MSFSSAVSAIKARMASNWTATPAGLQNGAALDGSVFEPPSAAPWVYLEVLGSGSDFASMGSPGTRLIRTRGIIHCHVFVPVNSGTDQAFSLADQVGALFCGADFDGVQCNAPTVDGGWSVDDDGNWFRVSVSVPFRYDYIG